jgi:uncharacterized protein (TIGR00255 family)
MTASMTAFARRDRETPWGPLSVELRSVNHRYLELSLRLPEELRSLEPRVRALIGKTLARGKVDCNLRFEPREATGDMAVDEPLTVRLLAASGRLQSLAHHGNHELAPLRTIDLLRWPGVLQTTTVDAAKLADAGMRVISETLAELSQTRDREGEQLNALMRQRLDGMEQIVAKVRALLPEIVQSFRARLEARLADIRDQLDPARLEQEVVLFAQKTDVDEELDRLATHINETRRVLGESGQIGRRLDFLMQELNREANTLGSKAADLRLTNAAVDLKVLIEQMREQVQNIE